MHVKRRLRVAAVAALLVAITLTTLSTIGARDDILVEEIEARMIPVEGAETPYGIPLSLDSLPTFIGWWYTMVPSIESDPRYVDALTSLVAPCCDDNAAFRCCCEKNGQACNIIRSGKGLAAHLISDLGYTTEQVRESVLQWFRFARPDYYVAAELESQRLSPAAYGLPTKGSCYRWACDTPISQGGCGGMDELIEPAIGASQG